jgi:hypothetical protein
MSYAEVTAALGFSQLELKHGDLAMHFPIDGMLLGRAGSRTRDETLVWICR